MFGPLNKIFKRNLNAMSTYGLGARINSEQFKNILDSNDLELEFRVLDMSVLQSTLTEKDFKLSNVSSKDLEMAEKAEIRKNVIQITFPGVALLWDLQEDKEVSFIWK